MRLTCGHLEQCGVRSECLSTNFGSIKIRPVLPFYPQFSFRDPNMSAIAKFTSPVAPVATESRDWTKALTPELQSGSEDESDILDAKARERHRRKQVKREEKQHREEAERRAREEAEARAREEVEHAKAEAEQKAREEVERQAREQVEKDRAEVQWRAAEVAARQRALAQEASKKRAREEPEAGPSGDQSNNAQ